MRAILFFLICIFGCSCVQGASIGISPPSLALEGDCGQVTVINTDARTIEVLHHPIQGISITPQNLTIPPGGSGRLVLCDDDAKAGEHGLRLIAMPQGDVGGGFHPGAEVTISINESRDVSEVTAHLTRGVLSDDSGTAAEPTIRTIDMTGIMITFSIVVGGLGFRTVKKKLQKGTTEKRVSPGSKKDI